MISDISAISDECKKKKKWEKEMAKLIKGLLEKVKSIIITQ